MLFYVCSSDFSRQHDLFLDFSNTLLASNTDFKGFLIHLGFMNDYCNFSYCRTFIAVMESMGLTKATNLVGYPSEWIEGLAVMGIELTR